MNSKLVMMLGRWLLKMENEIEENFKKGKVLKYIIVLILFILSFIIGIKIASWIF